MVRSFGLPALFAAILIGCADPGVSPSTDSPSDGIDGHIRPSVSRDVQITQPITTAYGTQADFNGRIRRVRVIDKQGDATYRTVIVVVGDTNNEVVAVELTSGDKSAAAKPIDQSEDEEGHSAVFDDGGGLFGKWPSEGVYSITATMRASDGSQLGEPQTFLAEVASKPSRESEVVDVGIVSRDKGRTWSVEMRVRDGGKMVETVVLETVKPDKEGAPLPSRWQKELSLIDTEPGQVEVYSGKIEFEPNKPSGFIYVIEYQFGSGARLITGSSNEKAELH
jgi:hypothetical protein